MMLTKEGKELLKKSLFGIVIGILLGAIFGYINNSVVFGFTGGGLIILSICIVILFPDSTMKKIIYLSVYVILVSAILGYFFSFINTTQFFNEPNKRELPQQIIDNFKNWSILASVLRVIHILLGLVATVCSILVTMDIKKIDGDKKKWLAFTAAVSFSILSAFDLGDKANRTRTAWRYMNTAIIKYQEGVDTSKKDLIDAYDEAEKIIGDVKPSPKDGTVNTK